MDAASGGSVRYSIVVRGRLSQRFTSGFPGVRAAPSGDATRLDTEPLDQSQFFGLLERLRDLAVEVVSVHELNTREAPD